MQRTLSLLLLLLSTSACAAKKWADKNADVSAVRTFPQPAESLYPLTTDLLMLEKIMPADCASDWKVGQPSSGMGANGTVRYDIGGMHRSLGFVLNKTTAPSQVDIEHLGPKGFVTRFALRPAGEGSEVELHTYLNAPKWPFTGFFFKKVQPAWIDCYERALGNLAGLAPTAVNPSGTPPAP